MKSSTRLSSAHKQMHSKQQAQMNQLKTLWCHLPKLPKRRRCINQHLPRLWYRCPQILRHLPTPFSVGGGKRIPMRSVSIHDREVIESSKNYLPNPVLKGFRLPGLSPGNCRFRTTVDMFLQRYKDAKGDHQKKAEIIATTKKIIESRCPDGVAFVKYENSRWWRVDERTAREKIGAHFRDRLGIQYASSGRSKIARRRQRRHLQTFLDSGSSSVSLSSC